MILSAILKNDRLNKDRFRESDGFYNRVPVRINEFILVENKKDTVVFETTDRKRCDDGPKVRVHIKNDDGWSVIREQGCKYTQICGSYEFNDEKLERLRAFWHASQFMKGNKMNYKERFSTRRQIEDDANIFDDDAFFNGQNPSTKDPFSEFLRQ